MAFKRRRKKEEGRKDVRFWRGQNAMSITGERKPGREPHKSRQWSLGKMAFRRLGAKLLYCDKWM